MISILNINYSNPKQTLLLALVLLWFGAKGQNDTIVINCDLNNKAHKVSEHLVGTNTIYDFMGDGLWDTTEIKSALMQMNCDLLRWPGGGPTSNYHWNNLNGQGYKDRWNPEYDTINDMPAESYLDLDEYIALVNEIGATPLVGINLASGLRYDRVQDGIDEAKALVQYCVDNNYNVKRYFLDNEPYREHAGVEMTWQVYAEQIKLYAPEIRAIDSTAEIIINWRNNIRRNDVWLLLQEVGSYIDVYDAHWYWNWSEASFYNWRQQFPMDPDPNSGVRESYKQEIEFFKANAAWLNLGHLKLASLEWNIGPSVHKDSTPSLYQSAIMQSEMLMQFIDGNLDMAAFWTIFWPNNNPEKTEKGNTRYLMNPVDDYSLCYNFDMFELLSEAGGKTKCKAVSDNKFLYPLALTNNSGSETLIYCNYKGSTERVIEMDAPKSETYSLKIFSADDAEMNSGSTKDAEVKYNEESNKYEFKMPPYSLVQLKIGELISNVDLKHKGAGSLDIFPNPSTDNVHINFKHASYPYSVDIATMQGMQVYYNDQVNGETQIDVSGLNTGMYLVNVCLNGKQYVQKFIKK